MSLQQFIKPIRYRVVLGHVCGLMRLLGGILVVPALLAVGFSEYPQAIVFAALAAGSFAVGMTGRAVGHTEMDGKEALVVVALSYLLYGLVGGLAFLSETAYINGFFEAMSGFTTTGLSVLNPEELPRSLVFFRSYSQWIGGAGIIILSLVILVGPSRNAFRLYTSEFGEENLVGSTRATARIVFTVYGILTVSGYIVYLIAGAGFFDALVYILSSVSTGGFGPYVRSVGQLDAPYLHAVMVLFMIMGSISFPAYYLLRKEGVRSCLRDIQLRTLLGMIIAGAVLMWGAWGWQMERILPSLFQSASALTTTGFTTINESDWPETVTAVVILFMIVGGSAGSTSGGLKIYRVILLFKVTRWYLMRAILPEEARMGVRIAGRPLSDDVLRQSFSYLGLYLLIIVGSTLAFVVSGYDLLPSLFDVASATGTVGLSSGVVSSTLPSGLKIVLILDMWAGRLEILAVLVILYPLIWIPRRSKQ